MLGIGLNVRMKNHPKEQPHWIGYYKDTERFLKYWVLHLPREVIDEIHLVLCSLQIYSQEVFRDSHWVITNAIKTICICCSSTVALYMYIDTGSPQLNQFTQLHYWWPVSDHAALPGNLIEDSSNTCTHCTLDLTLMGTDRLVHSI